ncbi:MAG: hypothetical protein H7320_04535 [Ferruginibacter sp.]|nr:hypothetical protein [Ferruginibacter sp.]
MKKLIFMMAGIVFTTLAMAQSTETKVERDKKKTESQLKNTIKEKKEEKKEVGKDLKHLKLDKAIEDRKDVRAERRAEHKKARHLRKVHGVKNPIHKAQKEIREEKKD